MPSLAEVKEANAAFDPPYIPVAIFAGGTSGIGEAMAKQFAEITKGNAHIIILGRNRAAAESIITTFPKPTSPEAIHEFVECDVVLMKNIQKVTKSLLSRLSRLNFLVLSTGTLDLKGRVETEEGIDKKLALAYYSRWKFIHDLSPLLNKAKEQSQVASVMTVLNPAGAGKLDLENLGMKKQYSLFGFMQTAASYSDLMIEGFAERYPAVSYIHIFPGLVRTPLMVPFSHWALTPLNWLSQALLYFQSVSPEYCAQYMLWALLQAESGATRRDNNGQVLGASPHYSGNEDVEKLWSHTEGEIEKALSVST